MENQSKTSGDASVGRDNTTHPDFTWQDLDNDLDNYVVADQWFYSRHHVKAAIPVLKPIIYTGFLLSVIIITSGIGEIIWDAYLSPEFDIFGVKNNCLACWGRFYNSGHIIYGLSCKKYIVKYI